MSQTQQHHAPDVRKYFYVFAALMVLLALTVIAAKLTHGHGALGVVIAMIIAIIKAVLVVMFFMHIKGATGLTKVFVVVGLLWLSILVALTLNDYLTRDWLPPSNGWTPDNPKAEIKTPSPNAPPRSE
jgi:cytochrome c oxidase subunit 4